MRGWSRKSLIGAALLALLAGCASGPRFGTAGVALEITPRQARAEPQRLEGRSVLWAGVVVDNANLAETSRLEVLAYPLETDQGPDLDREPFGRFLVVRSGYLEPVDYAPGRAVTVLGRLAGTRTGKVGEAPYEYPVVEAERLHLWPAGSLGRTAPQFHFGIGVIFSN